MSAISFSLLTVPTLHQSNRAFFTIPNAIPPFPSPFPSHYAPTFKPLRVSARESLPLSETAVSQNPTVTVENDDDATAFVIRARNRIGLLQVITRVFQVMGLRIEKAVVEFEGEFFVKRFFVTDSSGKKIEERENLERIEKALVEAISGDVDGGGGVVVSISNISQLGMSNNCESLWRDKDARNSWGEKGGRLGNVTATNPTFFLAYLPLLLLAMATLSLNVGNFITLRLTQNDYPLWREQALALAESQELVGHLTNEDPAPKKFTTPNQNSSENAEKSTPQLTDAFIAWRKSDRLLRGWVIGTLSEEALGLVVGLDTTHVV